MHLAYCYLTRGNIPNTQTVKQLKSNKKFSTSCSITLYILSSTGISVEISAFLAILVISNNRF